MAAHDKTLTGEEALVHRVLELWHEVRAAPEAVAQAALAASEEARSHGWKRGRAAALVMAGGAETFLLRPQDALRHLLEALSLAGEVKAHDVLARGYLRLAAIYGQVGDYAVAFEHLDRCFQEAKLAKDEVTEAAALNNSGELFRELGRYDDALAYYDRALETARRVGHPGSPGIYIGNRGAARKALGQTDEAERDLEEAAAIHSAYANIPGLVEVDCDLAELATARGDAFAAEAKYRAALELASSHGLAQSECEVQNDYGVWLLERGRLEEAEARLRRAMDLAVGRGAKRYIASILGSLARVAAARNDHKRAYIRQRLADRLRQAAFGAGVELKMTALRMRNDLSWAQREARLAKSESAALKRRTREIERSYEMARLVTRLGRAVAAELDLEDACAELYHGLRRFMDVPGFALATVAPESGELHIDPAMDAGQPVRPASDPLDRNGPWWRCFRERAEIRESAADLCVPSPSALTVLYLPVMFGAEALGVMSVWSDRPGAWDDDALAALRALAAFVAVAIKNARRLEDENARREAEIFRLRNVELKAKGDELEKALAEVKEYARREKEYKDMILAWNKRLEEQVKRRTRELEKLAILDGLTGLFNRRHAFELLDRELKASFRHKRSLSVLMIDVDDFKQVNDERGHRAGDAVLAEVARSIRSRLRSSDLAGRYGGEEFLVILPETPLSGAAVLAERIRTGIREASPFAAMGLSLSVSCGAAELADGMDCMALVELADSRLYMAKERGKDQVATGIDEPETV